MEERDQTLVRVFREISVKEIIMGSVSYDNLSGKQIQKIFDAYDQNADETETLNRLSYLKDAIDFELHEAGKSGRSGLNVFDLVNSFVKDALIQMHEEIVCRFEKLQQWHLVTNKIGEDLFVAAAYARIDYRNGKTRNTFTWKNVIGHNNLQLNTILSEGISENHFHLNGSTPYFDLSWLSLMNSVTKPEFFMYLNEIDKNLMTPRASYQGSGTNNSVEFSFSEMHVQAALIRLYLYSVLSGRKIKLAEYPVRWEWLLEYCFEKEPVCESVLRFMESSEMKKMEEDEFKEIFLDEIQKTCPDFARLFMCCFMPLMGKNDLIYMGQSGNLLTFLCSFFKISHCKPPELESVRWMFRCKDMFFYEREWAAQTYRVLKDFLKNPKILMSNRKEIQRIIDTFHDFGNNEKKDYAMNAAGSWYSKDKANAVFSGERWILYTMMQERYRQDNEILKRCYNLFYAYLVIKERFRMELLQNNDKTGFLNFKKYQSRKSWFTSEYTEGEMAKMAVDTVFKNQVIKSLELRIKPGNSCRENVEIISRYDRSIDEQEIFRKYFYYVFHFSKRKDDTLEKNQYLFQGNMFSSTGRNGKSSNYSQMIYRHYGLRKTIRRQTMAIVQFRKKNPEIAQRLRGIDACSNEDGCRPEVFATAYRVLKNHSDYRGLSLKPEMPQLRATYHVGEVFQDILDGLRAIDEAIMFLNLDCGDRLGHATVLGMDAAEWYRKRAYSFSIRRQDYLDNIVWLYHRLIQYHIPNSETLLEHLKKQFQLHFSMIYEKALDTDYIKEAIKEACRYDKEYGDIDRSGMNPYEFNINIYYFAWMLRGDDPGLYADGYYKRIHNGMGIWDEYCVNPYYPREHRIRYIPAASILNHYYHYDPTVRELGDKMITVQIPAQMAAGIAAVQKKLQQEIAVREIAIETNPSSNVQINSFKMYGKHPVLQLYNKGLTNDPEELKSCEQLNVSINTDDQGVFATCLSNEYALMASALGQLKDENGEYLYQKSMIYDWIKNIKEMSNNQSFLHTNDRNTEMLIRDRQKNATGESNAWIYNSFS